MTVTIGTDGTPSQSYVSNKMNSTATLKGDFARKTDYYIAIRSADFAKGLTVSIYMNDGSKGSRVYSSSKTAPEQKIDRNSILDLKELNVASFKTTAPSDQFLAYLHGYNVEIGDVKLHKTSGITPKLITAKSAAQVLKNEFHDKTDDVLLFLEQNEGCSFKIGSHSNIKGNVRLVGRKSKVDITNNGYFQAINGSLMLKNINFTLSHSGVFATNNSTSTTGSLSQFYIQDCTIKNLQKQLFNSPSSTYGIDKIYLKNNDIEIVNTTQLFNGIKTETSLLKLEQNVIYNTSKAGVDFQIYANSQAGDITTIEIKYNTIGNCNPSSYGYLYINGCSTANITNNLFHIPTYIQYKVILRTKTADYPKAGTIKTNVSYSPGNTLKACHLTPTSSDVTQENVPRNNDNSMLTADSSVESGIYKSSNSTYGATR